MNSYNKRLLELRNSHGLSLKELAKQVHVSSFKLFLYENGYFRPSKKVLNKLESFYKEEISIKGIDAYPTTTYEKKEKKHSKSLFIKRIVFGVLSLVMLASSVSGALIFDKSVNNEDSYYGQVYNDLKAKVIKEGVVGHDLITALEYYKKNIVDGGREATVIFYKTDNILFFNECTYSDSYIDSTRGIVRCHLSFGQSLGTSSYVCEFTLASITLGSYFSCNFDYDEGVVSSLYNFNLIVKGNDDINEQLALELLQPRLAQAEELLSTLVSQELGGQYSFSKDFLPAREQGRIVNFSMQIAALILIITGVLFFFIFFGLFLNYMVVNIKPRLVSTKNMNQQDVLDSLPNDIDVKVGIPDIFVTNVARIMMVASVVMMVISFLAQTSILHLPSFFSSNELSSILKITLLASIFLAQFIILATHKKPDALLKRIIYDLFLFLSIATIETVVIAITNAWGYDFANLIYSYLPSNIFEIVAIHYVIFLFLFFQPPFLSKAKKYVRYLWHSLSLIPLGFLVVTYFISNSYQLTYGVKENIYVNFWFPNGFLPLSIVSVLFMYTIFFLRLYFERKYGPKNAQIFFFGDRYNLIENSVCCIFIIIVGILDLLFMYNQVAFYLGLGYNQWIFALIPFIFFCKYSPNKQQTVLLDDELNLIKR